VKQQYCVSCAIHARLVSTWVTKQSSAYRGPVPS
jgi:ribosomal protein S26